MNVTLDTNCLIDIEEDRENAIYLRQLIRWHRDKIKLRVVGISASERQPNGRISKTFKEFKQKLKNIGLEDIEVLKPMGYISICYLDWAIISNEKMQNDELSIHNILFPDIEFRYKDYCLKKQINPLETKINWKWLNAKCDVQVLWSHIHYGGGILVTSDNNFHKESKKPLLISLGVDGILTPKDALKKISGLYK